MDVWADICYRHVFLTILYKRAEFDPLIFILCCTFNEPGSIRAQRVGNLAAKLELRGVSPAAPHLSAQYYYSTTCSISD